MSVITRVTGGVLAAVVAGGLALAGPASAAAHPRTTAGLHAKIAVHAGVQPNTVPTTTYGAGYFTYPGDANGLASVSATYTMPDFSCVHSGDNEWLLPGIWVFSSGTLTEQVDVNFNCNGGVKLQPDVICITGATCDQSLAIAPGDKIVASLSYTPTATVGTIKDVTAGTQAQVVGGAITTDDTVFVGDFGPSVFGVSKVPSFSKVKFSSVQVNGQYLADAPFPTQYNLKTGTSLQITSTHILGGGSSFTTAFRHS